MKKMYILAFFALFVVPAQVWGDNLHYDATSVANVQKNYSSLTSSYNLTFNFTGKSWDTGITYNYSVNITIKSEKPQDQYLCGTVDIDGVTWYFSSSKGNIKLGANERYLAKLPANNLTIMKDQNSTYHLVDGTLTFASSFTATPTTSYIYHFKEITISEEEDVTRKLSYGDMKCINKLTLGRTLSDDYYNTFCSPVSGDVETLLGAGAEVYEFAAVSGDVENGYTFTFSPLGGNIEAGVPYLVKPSSDIAQIELTNVATSRLTTTPQTVTPHDGFSFCGVLAPADLSGGEYILGDGDLLYKALPGQMKGMRAYFTLPAQSGVAPRVSMNILSQTNTPTGWQAQKHNSTIQKKLHNGRLLILRDKKTYDILGNKQ